MWIGEMREVWGKSWEEGVVKSVEEVGRGWWCFVCGRRGGWFVVYGSGFDWVSC